MRSGRRASAALFGGAIVSAAILALTGPAASAAQPAASASSCPANTFCLYQNANFTGTQWDFPAGSYKECNFRRLGAGLDNNASSHINNTGYLVRLYANEDNCTGTRYLARPHTSDATFVNNDFNDRASGISFG